LAHRPQRIAGQWRANPHLIHPERLNALDIFFTEQFTGVEQNFLGLGMQDFRNRYPSRSSRKASTTSPPSTRAFMATPLAPGSHLR
jgi:hypothetical protein